MKHSAVNPKSDECAICLALLHMTARYITNDQGKKEMLQ
jgi:hypothetical protein